MSVFLKTPCKTNALAFIYLSGILLILFTSCGPARHLNEDEKLLTKIKIKSSKKIEFKEELKSISKQKPNRKLLGLFKIYLGIYNLYYNKEEVKIKEKLGEPPAIYDSTLLTSSVQLMSRFLNNRSYYDNEVSAKTKLSKKRARIQYLIKKGDAYRINNLNYTIEDLAIEQLIEKNETDAIIKKKGLFQLEDIQKERLRIERLLRNHGYYNFTREYILIEADTSQLLKFANLNVVLKNLDEANQSKPQTDQTDSTQAVLHPIFSIKDVIVRIDYTRQNIQQYSGDTLEVDKVKFIEYELDRFRKDVLARNIYIRPGDIYNLEAQEQTYNNLSSLGIFSFVGIQFDYDFSDGNALVVYINLNPRKQKALTLETEGTNNGGNLGINGTVSLRNNNAFRGAENFNISLNGGLEVQQILTENNDNLVGDGFLPFNTFEFGPEISFEIPRFLLPINQKRFSPKGNPRTTINASYNFQQRPDYLRNVSKLFLAYSWNETPKKKHIIQPVDLSYIKLKPSLDFLSVLENINNPFLKNSYTDNFIVATKYSFIYNSQLQDEKDNHVFLRFNLESAGNAVSLLNESVVKDQNEDGSYNLAGIRYAQYFLSDIDVRYYQQINENQMVYRFSAGVGLPYGNSNAMPFEKSFFAGGANGIRAWRVRELGPGTISDSSVTLIDQIGNLKIESNLEFRFPITKVIEGAAFADFGNIWNVKQDDIRSETKFKLDRLWEATAVGLGAGLRLNFTFFLLRFDFATPFKDPSASNPSRIQPQWRRTNLNLGIGYPF